MRFHWIGTGYVNEYSSSLKWTYTTQVSYAINDKAYNMTIEAEVGWKVLKEIQDQPIIIWISLICNQLEDNE